MEDNGFQNALEASQFFSLIWLSITKDNDISYIICLMTTFHCSSKARYYKSPTVFVNKCKSLQYLVHDIPYSRLRKQPISVWGRGGNNIINLDLHTKTNPVFMFFWLYSKNLRKHFSYVNLTRSFDIKDQRKTTIYPYKRATL